MGTATPRLLPSTGSGNNPPLRATTAWVGSRDFTPAAIAAFTGSAADYLLVAYAKEHEHVLVTHERSDPNAKARIFIPDACIALGVEYADTFKMLRETGAHLDLRPNGEH